MGDDLLDLPVLRARRAVRGAGRRGARSAGARRTGSAPAAAAAARCASCIELVLRAQGRWDAASARVPGADPDGRTSLVLVGLVALLARPGGRQGVGALQAARRPLDRSPPRARVAALHARPQLPRRQPDRSGDRRADARRRRPTGDPLEIHLILGNLYREKGQVGRAIQEHQSAAAAAEPAQARARQRPALPRPRLQARRLRRSRARGVHRGAAARSRQPVRARRTSRSCYEEQHQWAEAYATRQKLAQRGAGRRRSRRHQRDPRVPRERARPARR